MRIVNIKEYDTELYPDLNYHNILFPCDENIIQNWKIGDEGKLGATFLSTFVSMIEFIIQSFFEVSAEEMLLFAETSFLYFVLYLTDDLGQVSRV